MRTVGIVFFTHILGLRRTTDRMIAMLVMIVPVMMVIVMMVIVMPIIRLRMA